MTSPTPGHRFPNGAGLLLLFAVLGGVFAMHALDVHGVAGNHPAGNHPVGMTSLAAAPTSAHSPAVREVASSASLMRAPADDSTAMALCLGVLAASVLLLLVRRALRLPLEGLASPWRTVTQRSSGVGVGRDRDPPSRALLSVHRC